MDNIRHARNPILHTLLIILSVSPEKNGWRAACNSHVISRGSKLTQNTSHLNTFQSLMRNRALHTQNVEWDQLNKYLRKILFNDDAIMSMCVLFFWVIRNLQLAEGSTMAMCSSMITAEKAAGMLLAWCAVSLLRRCEKLLCLCEKCEYARRFFFSFYSECECLRHRMSILIVSHWVLEKRKIIEKKNCAWTCCAVWY